MTSDGLQRANTAFRNYKILEDASLDRAKIGTQTGQAEVFTPAQLIAAARKSEKAYGGNTPLKQYGKMGQDVIPSTVPNSGTADRLMQFGLGASALGASAGVDAYSDSETLTPTAGILAALTLGGTKGGQKALNALLTERPEVVRELTKNVSRNRYMRGLFGGPSGLVGSGAAGYALSN